MVFQQKSNHPTIHSAQPQLQRLKGLDLRRAADETDETSPSAIRLDDDGRVSVSGSGAHHWEEQAQGFWGHKNRDLAGCLEHVLMWRASKTAFPSWNIYWEWVIGL